MPHASLKLRPGIDTNETPTLNEAGLSASNLIRFIPDRNGLGLIQKLGGWTKYYSGQMVAVVRNLLAWEDTNNNKWLAVGTESRTSGALAGQAQLAVLNGVMGTNGITTATTLTDITPRLLSNNVTAAAQTFASSSLVTITDATAIGITPFDSVYITVPISVGGIVLFGQYPVYANVGSTQYQIQALDVFGNLQIAVSASTTTTVPSFTTVNTESSVTVTLENHGYSVGSTFPVLVSTAVGGVTLYGNSIVQTVLSSSQFMIQAVNSATSGATVFQNGGNARYVYSIGVGPAIASTGYGIGGYGIGGYGTGSPVVATTGTPIGASNWSLDNWGQILIASPNGANTNSIKLSGIYEWDPTSNAPTATIIPQAPTVNEGFFIAMPERQIIAWGSTFDGIQDPLLVRWCDLNNYNSWTASITNQAGSYRIPKGSRIVGAIQGPQQGLIWTDLAVWSMQYINQPFIYGFNEIGTGCGLIAKRAATSLSGIVYWMGQSQFYKLDGSGVSPIACPVWDVIFQDLDMSKLDKIRIAPNSRFGEIAWYYPTNGNGGEINAYVKYNVYLQTWDFGTLSRTSWINESVLGPPIGSDPVSNYIYQHETSPDADSQPLLASFSTGYFVLAEADVKTFIDQVWPDMRWGYYGGAQNATVNIKFNVTDYSGQTPTAFGPYSLTTDTNFISPRIRGRLVQINLNSSDVGSWWRIGNIRYRFQQDGKF